MHDHSSAIVPALATEWAPYEADLNVRVFNAA